ncbi:plasma kallikrein-like [Mya arenaria]|uniref:plasma kallikrein-like n=1 Tax=Mya arenaria TaxID=6604 RepID=UPI0022E556CD|nr:plasma kallikrein-like [Mya arenaria]
MRFEIVVTLSIFVTTFGQTTPPTQVPCGVPVIQPVTTRIVGGTTAVPGSWPYVVMITDPQGYIIGSGAILHPHVILTAAQNFVLPGFVVSEQTLHLWRLYAGEYNISTSDPHEKFYHIQRILIHKNYSTSTLENDVALILTREPIVFNDHTRPACLPDSSHTYTAGEVCYLAGWGSTRNTGDEEVMNQVDMPILADSVCAGHWDDFLPDTELCAGHENGGKDFCEDDIGSPLMCKDSNGAWYIQGLASSGGNCTLANEPGIFEDVSQYTDWVKGVMTAAGYDYQY